MRTDVSKSAASSNYRPADPSALSPSLNYEVCSPVTHTRTPTHVRRVEGHTRRQDLHSRITEAAHVEAFTAHHTHWRVRRRQKPTNKRAKKQAEISARETNAVSFTNAQTYEEAGTHWEQERQSAICMRTVPMDGSEGGSTCSSEDKSEAGRPTRERRLTVVVGSVWHRVPAGRRATATRHTQSNQALHREKTARPSPTRQLSPSSSPASHCFLVGVVIRPAEATEHCHRPGTSRNVERQLPNCRNSSSVGTPCTIVPRLCPASTFNTKDYFVRDNNSGVL